MTREEKIDNILLLLMALGASLFHIALNGAYGFHRDELDFIMNARQLDWGYVSYPPLTPLFARIGLEVFGESLRGLRVLPAVAQGAAMVLAGLMARDMGGKRKAQILTAFTVFIAPVSLFGGTVIMYFAFDYLWWALVAFFMVRLLASGDARYWLGVGAGIGLGMMTKYTMAFWVAGLVVGVLITPARATLKTKWPYLGAGLALLICLPNLIWQGQHGFVAIDHLSAIHARDVEWGRAEAFLPEQLYLTTNPFSLPLWVAGLGLCLFSSSMKRFRPLVWMFAVSFALFLINKGRGYYPAPAYVMLLAAGGVWIEDWLGRLGGKMRQVGTGLLWTTQAMGCLVGVILMKPVAPVGSALWDLTTGITDDLFTEMVGWEELTALVAQVYRSIPESEKPNTVILAGNYGEAGALDLYGDAHGLPRVISGANSYWYRGYGEPEPETVIVVGFEVDYAKLFFKSCQASGRVKNSYNVKNEETLHHTGLYVCRDSSQPWSVMWQRMQWYQ